MTATLAPGLYRFTTYTGSVYSLLISDEGSTLTRLPGAATVHPAMDGHETSPLRRDAEAITVLKVIRLEVDKNADFILDLRRDGIETLRSTSPVVSIETVPTD